MRKYDTVIFDIDGTLAATNELIFASFNHITEKYLGKRLSNEEIINLFGPTEDVIITQWFGEDCDEIREEYYGFYLRNHQSMAKVYEGIPELLQMLTDAGAYLAAFTGKGRRTAEITLEQTGLSKYFKLLVSGDDVVNHKPHCEGILKIIEASGNPPERTVMIGDSVADIKAAKDAGVKVYSCVWDSYEIKKVAILSSKSIVKTTTQLTNILLDAIE